MTVVGIEVLRATIEGKRSFSTYADALTAKLAAKKEQT